MNSYNVIVKPIKDLTSREYKHCYSLNLRQNGLMQFQLMQCRKKKTGFAFMIYDNDKLMSWALIFDRHNVTKSAYFYTRASERKKGYASAITSRIKLFNDVTVYPWNSSSDSFFSKRILKRNYYYWKTGELRYAM
jgi:hypothetical protein